MSFSRPTLLHGVTYVHPPDNCHLVTE